MPRKPVIPAAVADSLTADKPPSASVSARAVSVLYTDAADVLASKTIDDLTCEILALQIQGSKVLLAIGKRLIAAKDKLSHGDWLPWLESVNIPERLAQRYMKLARGWSANPTILTDLGMSKALALLALPDDVRDEFIIEGHCVNGAEKSVVDMSAKELADAIKARKDAEYALEMTKQELATSERRLNEATQAKNDMSSELSKANQSLADTQKALTETRNLLDTEQQARVAVADELAALKAKPVDVAVQKIVDPDALEQARKEVREKMQMDLDFARSDAETARQSLATAKADAEKAEQARKDTEAALIEANKATDAARKELERVKAEKKPLADKDLSLFSVLYEQAQVTVNQMQGIILKLSPNKQENTRKALSALADKIRKAAEQS